MPNIGFSVPIFFVLFREATEASIVISILLSFINNLTTAPSSSSPSALSTSNPNQNLHSSSPSSVPAAALYEDYGHGHGFEHGNGKDIEVQVNNTSSNNNNNNIDIALVRSLKRSVWFGTLAGLALSLSIGAVFMICWSVLTVFLLLHFLVVPIFENMPYC
jgi:high-affinity Fe2+/Pb2+ permease